MTTYAIGDVRGSLATLQQLLDTIHFNAEEDTLWFTGDLVNTGPDSLAVLRFIKGLSKRAVTVLGHQEMRLLAIAEGIENEQEGDRFAEILAAPDRTDLLKWLCQRPLLHHQLNFTLVHAGIHPEWSLSKARTFAIEVESSMSMGQRKTFLENIRGDTPTRWHAKHRGWNRVRFITNAFTRMHFCNDIGRLDFSHEKSLEAPKGYVPWYLMGGRAMSEHNIIFGHGAVDQETLHSSLYPLDTGCAHGGALSAIDLSAPTEKISVPCSAH